MIRKYGDMWTAYDTSQLFMITTNAAVKRNGELVMGRGIALQAKKRFPELPASLGAKIKADNFVLSRYGLLIFPSWPSNKIAAFQVKYHWSEQADINLIDYSTDMLLEWLQSHPKIKQVDLNMPGVGNGKLNIADVLPIVSRLPDTVNVWTY